MQKFILIRGHQGSGKSTFAEQKAAEFKAQYQDAEVVRIENDLFITCLLYTSPSPRDA